MTTAVSPQSASPREGFDRTVPIAANLLPDEIVFARRAQHVRRLVAFVVVMVVLAMGGWYGATRYQIAGVQEELAFEEDRARNLIQQQKQYAEVVQIRAGSKAIQTQLGTLLADDLSWSAVLSDARAAAPTGVQLTDLNGALAGEAAPDSGRLPPTTDVEIVGALTISGAAGSKPQIAAYLDALGKTARLANPYLDSVSTEEEGGLRFTLRVDITGKALGGRYTQPDED